jgi:hypothetical protein
MFQVMLCGGMDSSCKSGSAVKTIQESWAMGM